MYIWNKVLLGFIIVLAPVAFILGLRALGTHEKQRTEVNNLEKDLANTAQGNRTLKYGETVEGEVTEPGVIHLETEVIALRDGMGTIWGNCSPRNLGQGNVVTVETGGPQPNGLQSNQSVFVFEQAATWPEPQAEADASTDSTGYDDLATAESSSEAADAPQVAGRFIGEFSVAQASDASVVLKPTRPLSQREADRLQDSVQSGGQWMMSNVLPTYLPIELAEGETDERTTIHPPFELNNAYEVRERLRNQQTALQSNVADLEKSEQLNKQHEQFLEQQIANVADEIAQAERERKLVQTHLEALQARVDELKAGVDDLLAKNAAANAKLAELQKEAIEKVDAATTVTAPAGM